MRAAVFSAPSPRILLTFKQVGELLGSSEAHVRRLVDRGELPSVHVGRLHRIARVDLDAYIEGLRSR